MGKHSTMSRRRNSHGGIFSIRPGDGGSTRSPVRTDEQFSRELERRQNEEAARPRRIEEDESARALGFDDGSHRKRITAAVQTVCTRNEVERMKKDGVSHITLTVENVDGGKVEVTVSDEARVVDVLAVACTKLSEPLPRSKAFWALPDALIQKYSDGWNPDGTPAGYPDWWLKRTGYQVL